MQPLICVGCSVHYWVSCASNKGGFFEIAFVVIVDTHLPHFEALAYVLPHFDTLTRVVIRVSSAFIFQTFAEVCYSVFVNGASFKSLLNLCKAYIFKSLLKVYYRSVFNASSKASSFKSVLKVYTLSKIFLWIKPSYISSENACYSWCMHQTGLLVVPQSKFTGELWSSAAVIPQSKSTEMLSSTAPFHHDLWYFRHWTNEHFSSMLFIRKNVTSPQ